MPIKSDDNIYKCFLNRILSEQKYREFFCISTENLRNLKYRQSANCFFFSMKKLRELVVSCIPRALEQTGNESTYSKLYPHSCKVRKNLLKFQYKKYWQDILADFSGFIFADLA